MMVRTCQLARPSQRLSLGDISPGVDYITSLVSSQYTHLFIGIVYLFIIYPCSFAITAYRARRRYLFSAFCDLNGTVDLTSSR